MMSTRPSPRSIVRPETIRGAQSSSAATCSPSAVKPCAKGDRTRRLGGRAAVEVLTSLRRREARYLVLLGAGYSYREIAEREGVTYTKVI